MSTLCDQCHAQLAVVFVTQITDDQTLKFRLCEECAREKALESEVFSEIVAQIEEDAELMAIVDSTSGDDEFPEILPDEDSVEIPLFTGDDPFNDSFFTPPDATIDPFDDDTFAPLAGEIAPRCGNCGTTWERIKEDGRCGCSSCYLTFQEQLVGVMARVHRGTTHLGKTPTAAHKRRLHAENLRKRRENQFALLQGRLRDAISAENYEEAARLRDKIKSVGEDI